MFFCCESLYQRSRLGGCTGQKIGLGKIVAVVVGAGVDLLRLLEQRARLGNFFGLDIELTEVMVGIVVVRRQLERFAELFAGELGVSVVKERRRKVGVGSGRIWLQSNRDLKVFHRFGILRLRGVGKSQELVDLKALRRMG